MLGCGSSIGKVSDQFWVVIHWGLLGDASYFFCPGPKEVWIGEVIDFCDPPVSRVMFGLDCSLTESTHGQLEGLFAVWGGVGSGSPEGMVSLVLADFESLSIVPVVCTEVVGFVQGDMLVGSHSYVVYNLSCWFVYRVWVEVSGCKVCEVLCGICSS